MEKLLEIFRKFKLRERILLIVALSVLFYIAIDKVLITPFFESIHETKERLETQKNLLKKYYSFVSNKNYYEGRLNDLEEYYTKLPICFLPCVDMLSGEASRNMAEPSSCTIKPIGLFMLGSA